MATNLSTLTKMSGKTVRLSSELNTCGAGGGFVGGTRGEHTLECVYVFVEKFQYLGSFIFVPKQSTGLDRQTE